MQQYDICCEEVVFPQISMILRYSTYRWLTTESENPRRGVRALSYLPGKSNIPKRVYNGQVSVTCRRKKTIRGERKGLTLRPQLLASGS